MMGIAFNSLDRKSGGSVRLFLTAETIGPFYRNIIPILRYLIRLKYGSRLLEVVKWNRNDTFGISSCTFVKAIFICACMRHRKDRDGTLRGAQSTYAEDERVTCIFVERKYVIAVPGGRTV
jgi:hypothetical protein